MIIVTKEEIKKRFDEYNKLYFGGVLGKCRFHVLPSTNTLLGRYYESCSGKGKETIDHICIGTCIYWTEEDLKDIVLHEMIHMYVRTIEHRRGGLFGHGWRFRRQIRRLRKDYGLNVHILLPDYYKKLKAKNKKNQFSLWEKFLFWFTTWI